MLNVDGSGDAPATASIWSGWNKLTTVLILIVTFLPANLNRMIYCCCDGKCMLRGSDNWPVKVS